MVGLTQGSNVVRGWACCVCRDAVLMDENGNPASLYWSNEGENLVFCSAKCGLVWYEKYQKYQKSVSP